MAESINNIKAAEKNIRKGCLLIHGFGGGVSEVEPLANYLSAKGFITECPSLKGHTGRRRDLKKCCYRDWIDSAVEGYNRLVSKCDVVYLIGFSMGGLIAFNIALKNKAEAIITLNTPIYYWNIKQVALNIIHDIKAHNVENTKRYLVSISNLPFRAMLNFRILLGRTKSVLAQVTCPLFTLQALQDDAVRKRSANYIYNLAGSNNKKLEFYDGSGHHILWSNIAETVIKDVEEFLNRCR